MRRLTGPLAGALMLLSGTAEAVPTQYAFTGIPDRFYSYDLTVGSRALGETCFSRGLMPDGTICNPAFLGELEEGSLLARVFIGNGYAALTTANQFVYGTITKSFLQQMFQNNNLTSVEAHVGLVFSSKYFMAGFSPYRVQYVSEIHNPNLPVVAVHAAVEKSLFFAFGRPLDFVSESLAEFSAGTRVRILRRNYVHGSFSLFDAINEEPRALLPSRGQNAILADASLGWHRPEARLAPRASLAVTSIGASSPQDALYPDQTDLALGAGIAPQLGPGRLKLGLDLTDIIRSETLGSTLRAGASYQYGIIEAMVGAREDVFTVGAQFGLQILQLGIAYEFVKQETGGGFAQRIATEAAIRL